ncbi:Maf-like protein [Haloimpatiens lingqiaonensis]|uniref:Maf-like protein n=1 Tax=Haloimpatiens lingqiaonensis TaxID=1380675 RepID=UPI0010FEF78A|nr:Maf-like protein [Haloimpatiens lingqiaonensis]
MDLVLASASPRRKEILGKVTENFTVVVSTFEEDTVKYKGDIQWYVKELSKGKAETVSANLKNEALVIGCDTVVSLQGNILGKPKDEQDAFFMLKSLSGKWHEVYSGITIINTKTNKFLSECVCTKVKFSHISDDDIKKYIETKEPMDKAGAYGIQGFAGIFVEKIEGCYYNVVGLPLNKLNFMMRDMGVNLL